MTNITGYTNLICLRTQLLAADTMNPNDGPSCSTEIGCYADFLLFDYTTENKYHF